jgi:hypothetical protein
LHGAVLRRRATGLGGFGRGGTSSRRLERQGVSGSPGAGSRRPFWRGDAHRLRSAGGAPPSSDGRRFGGVCGCTVATRHAGGGFGRGTQRSSVCRRGRRVARSVFFGGRGEADTEQAVTTGGQRPQRCGAAADEGNSSRGRNRAAGMPPDEPEHWTRPVNRVRERRKRSEPHGRYQVATDLGLARGVNRHGGEKPRRRNCCSVGTGQTKRWAPARRGRDPRVRDVGGGADE